MKVSSTLLALALAASSACGKRPGPAPSLASLGGDAAHVGGAAIPLALVVDVANARGVGKKEALDGLVADALLAEAAKSNGVDRTPELRWADTTATARRVPEHVLAEARAVGAPTDEELATVEVTHAVVLRSPSLSRERALAIAERIRQAVVPAADERDFRARAERVPHGGSRVTVETLEPFDAEGQTTGGSQIDRDFAAAAFALKGPGETSAVVLTPFGWHVIRLIRRTAAPRDTLELRRRDLAEAVLGMRVRRRLSLILDEQRSHSTVETSPAADALMAGVVASFP